MISKKTLHLFLCCCLFLVTNLFQLPSIEAYSNTSPPTTNLLGDDCDEVDITPTAGKITIDGLTAPIVIVKVFDSSWETIFECSNNCNVMEMVSGLNAGNYCVQIKFFNASWGLICDRLECIDVSDGGGGCNNVTNGGQIGYDESVCGAYDPARIQNIVSPSGGSGALEYIWLKSTNGCPTNLSQKISGATGAAYNPPSISQTTWYVRCSRRADCDEDSDWFAGESNCVKKEVKTSGCGGCANQGGDHDNDGVCADVDCDDDDANIGAQQTPGTACNDGNSNTINDEIQADGCTCAGTPVSGCDNVTNGGQIGYDESVCGAYDPARIQNIVSPSGGSGALEYIWLKSTNGCPTNLNQKIAGATGATYNPGVISQTTWYVRCSRRAGCDEDSDWFAGESNCVKKEVKTSGCGGCANQGGDHDNDGVCADVDCDDDDANIGAQQTPGTACNDGNSNTINDEIQADGCTCMGTPTGNDCDDVVITPSAGKITINGLNAPIVQVKVFNSSWQTVFECTNNCDAMEMVSGLNAGNYCVQIKYFTSSWSRICERLECIYVPGDSNPCDGQGGDADNDNVCADVDCDDNDPNIGAQQTSGTACNDGNSNTINDEIQADGCTCAGTPVNNCNNVTNGGQIGYDESVCGTYDPARIQNVVSPSGGSGALEYIWLKSTNGCPTNLNQQIPGATGATYNPPTISQTTWYVRCSRRAGCDEDTDWFAGESNCVKKEVKTSGCGGCANQGGDYDNDGVCADVDCDDYDASVGAQQAPGTSCDDGNSNTTNDEIQADGCTCVGTPTGNDCDDVVITPSAGKITINGLNAPIVQVKVFNSSWQTVFECTNNCDAMEMVSGLNAGNYCVQIKYFTSSWSRICERLECIYVPGDSNPCDGQGGDADNDNVCADVDCDDNDPNIGAQQTPGTACNDGNSNTINDEIQADGCTCAGTPVSGCDNVTNGGQIGYDESVCGAYDPARIQNVVSPSGGSGALEYIWLKSTNGCPTNLNQQIPGATGATYNPPTISQTTWYVRCSRRAGCDEDTDWFAGESNCVKKEVKTSGCGGCANQGGDYDNDGVCADVDCDDYDASVGAQQAPGTSCDDGNSNTTNDEIQADGCTCMGTPTGNDCDDVIITPSAGKITINGLNAPIVQVKVFNSSWQTVFECTNNCDAMEMVSGLNAGNYCVQIKYFTSSWSRICERLECIYVPGDSNPCDGQGGDADNDNVCADVDCDDNDPNIGAQQTPGTACNDGNSNTINDEIQADGCTCAGTPVSGCDNVTNGGQIGYDESVCGAYDPARIQNIVSPSGGSGALEYIWLKSTNGCPTNLNQQIPGATGATYNPPTISQTTWYVRCSRRAGCDEDTDWFAGESNCVKKEVKTSGCGGTPCETRTATNSKTSCGSGIAYGFYAEDIINGMNTSARYTVHNGSFKEFEDGTATYTGQIRNTENSNVRFNFDFNLSGRTFSTPSGSPQSTNCYAHNTSDWYYYTNLSGQLVGTRGVSGGVLNISIDPPAFQIGTGANLNDRNIFGASSWLNYSVVSQPSASGVSFDMGNQMDINVRLSGGTLDCPNGGGGSITLNCPNNITVTQNQNGGRMVSWNAPTASTTCSNGNANANQTGGPSSGSLFPVGATTVTYQATDACGNQATCSFTVTVNPDGGGNPPTGYCTNWADIPWHDWIARVEFGSIDNASSKVGYQNFTNLSTDVSKGQSYSISLTPGFSWTQYNEYWTVWIDYNRDGDFDDAGEKALQGNSSSTVVGSISIPGSAHTGPTRMRVVMQRGSYANSACGGIGEGEVEDYLVNITNSFGGGGASQLSSSTSASSLFYPNPASQEVNFKLDAFTGETVEILLIDVTGRIALRRTIKEAPASVLELSIATLPMGVYTVYVRTKDAYQVDKLLITK